MKISYLKKIILIVILTHFLLINSVPSSTADHELEGSIRHTTENYHVLDSSDNMVVVSRYQHEVNFDGGGIQVLKFNTSGNLLWSTLLPIHSALSPVLDNEDNLVFYTGNTLVMKLDSNGQSMWSKGFKTIDRLKIHIDSSNNIILVGRTEVNNHAVSNAYQSEFAGGRDIFIAKFDKNGIPIWSTSLGGTGYDTLVQSELDLDDNVVLCGSTNSSDFPLNDNPAQSKFGGDIDVFMSKLSKNGDLMWSSYIGGSAYDSPQNFLIDNDNNIILTGNTDSTDFPLKDAIFSIYTGQDVLGIGRPYISKFTSDGELSWSTYIGGDGTDVVTQIKLNENDELLMLGMTSSISFLGDNIDLSDTISELPISEPDLLIKSFILKITPDGILSWGLFFDYLVIDPYGWTMSFDKSHFEFDHNDKIILVGTTSNSNNIELMLKTIPLTSFSGRSDLFLIKLKSSGEAEWSTYLGGSDNDVHAQIKVNSNNDIIIAGRTDSANFPTINAFQNEHSPNHDTFFSYENEDGFLVKFTGNGEMVWSSFLGGTSSENVEKILLDSQDRLYVVGSTRSIDYPVENSYSSTFNGDSDTFITMFSNNGQAAWSTYLGPLIEQEFIPQQKSEEQSNLKEKILLATGFVGLSIPVIYFLRRKNELIPNELIDHVISEIADVSSEIIYLIAGAQKVSIDKQMHKDFMKQIPPDLFEYKFLLHPIRLAILKVMYDQVNLTTIQLKEILGLTWTEFNNIFKTMKRANLLFYHTKFVDDNVRIIVSLTNLGITQFRDLKRLLIDFLDDINTDKYIQYIDGLKDLLYPSLYNK